MVFGKIEAQEIIKLDNKNDNLNNGEKDLIKSELNSKEGKLMKYLVILKKQKVLLEKGEEVSDGNGGIKTLRDVSYEIAFLEDTLKSLADLKSDIKIGNELDITTISKYYLSNYELSPIGESYGIATEYRDLDKPIKTSDGFKITGYINYVSIVEGETVHKKLVILDDKNGNKNDHISDKKVYSISDEQIIEEPNFSIIGVKINEDRGYFKEKKQNHTEYGKNIEKKLEEEIKKLPNISEKLLELLSTLSSKEGIDKVTDDIYGDEYSNIDFTNVDYLLRGQIDENENIHDIISEATRSTLKNLKQDDKNIFLSQIEKNITHLISIGGEKSKKKIIQLISFGIIFDNNYINYCLEQKYISH